MVKLGILGLGSHYFKGHHDHFLANPDCQVVAVHFVDKCIHGGCI